MTFDPKINEFPGFMVEHLFVTLGNPSCNGFSDNVKSSQVKFNDQLCGQRAEKRTGKEMAVKTLDLPRYCRRRG